MVELPKWTEKNPAYNRTIRDAKKERFWTLTFKALFIGAMWWIRRSVDRQRVRPYRDLRGELLIMAAERYAKRKKWPGFYAGMWTMIWSNIVDVAATDNAYQAALYATLQEHKRLCEQNGVKGYGRMKR